jgi:hypothetical protein
MGWRHDEKSKYDDLIADIASKHCPDSIRRTAYEELERRGVSREEAHREADRKEGGFYG